MVAIHSEVMTKWNSFLMFVAQVMLNLDLSTNYFIIIEFHSTLLSLSIQGSSYNWCWSQQVKPFKVAQ